MAHPALLNADIVSIIYESLDRQSLVALTRTAKFLQDPALRLLWRDIKQFSHLLSLFGSSMHRDNERKIHLSKDLTATQWKRFRFYAQYVRTLVTTIDDDIEPSSFMVLFPHQPLLPRLKSLTVHSNWPDEAFFTLPMFFVASIQKFGIHSCRDSLTLEYLIAMLGTTVSALRELEISTPAPTPSLWSFERSKPVPRHSWDGQSISAFHNLHSIDMFLTSLQVHPILSHLSTLPSLSKIQFSINDLTGASATGSKYAFPAARELSIVCSGNHEIVDLLALTSFNKLINLVICCGTFLRNSDALFAAIPVSCNLSLNKITILGVRWSLEPMKISHLFNFVNIRSFYLTIKNILWPADGDIQDIARSWPNLEEFYARPSSSADEHEPSSQMTLSGFLLLIEQCTPLMKVIIGVDAREVPIVASSIRRPGLVIKIEPSFSPIDRDHPRSLADFLILALPDADVKLVDYTQSEDWEVVISLREYFIRGRQEGEKHH